jgi:ribosomal-protein-alanine N-acetyltransferase
MPKLSPVTLHTERLTLRWMDAGDADALFAIFSDPEVARYWSNPPWTDVQQARDAIAQALDAYASGSGMKMAVLHKDSGAMIGYTNFYAFYDQNRRCDLGYAMASAWWGKGYQTEALAAMIDHGFRALNLNRIEADIDPRNAGSARVLEKLGFQKEGFMPERWIVNGEVCDTAFYGLLRRNWNAP